jgi:type I restriction enzyme M protein
MLPFQKPLINNMTNPTAKLTQAQINNTVWAACDTFRGVIDPTQYKDYILTMLFIKYISDVSKERKHFYIKKYDGNEARVERAMRNERFQVPEESSFDFLYQKRGGADIGELINIALENIEEANRTKLEGVFRNIDFNSNANLGEMKERNIRLKNLLTDFAKLDLRPSNLEGNDVIGDAYEYLIENFAADAGKKAGEFYTPKEVSMLLAKLIEPQSGNRICDPTCGSGSLLIKVAKEISDNNFVLYGQELNSSTWALARMNMFLHEMDNATIERGDTIKNPKLLEADQLIKYDIVVANPPFSLKKWGAEEVDGDKDQHNRFHRGLPPKSKGDYAFITHMIETLNEHGKAGVIVPHGVLFRGSAEGKIRKQFIDENLLKAVIGLPANLFFGTGIPAAILIFDKNKTTNEVLFIDASREYASGTNQNKLRVGDENNTDAPNDLQKIYNTFKSWETIDKYSFVATIDDIQENEYNLNIPRYVDTFEEETPVDIPQTQLEIAQLKAELTVVEAQMNQYLKELGF